MNLYRKAFARHYCPHCDNRTMPARPDGLEGMVVGAAWWLVTGFVWLPVAMVLEQKANGWLLASWPVACVISAVTFGPWILGKRTFVCRRCGRRSTLAETRAVGWSLDVLR